MSDDANIFELMTRKEPLLPELQWHIKPVTGPVPACVQHPLLHELIFDMTRCALLNAQYRARKEAAQVMLGQKNVAAYMALVARPWRWKEFVKHAHLLTDAAAYWELAAWMLIDTENQWQNSHEIKAAMEPALPAVPPEWRAKRHFLMDVSEQERFNALPDTLHVYRGHDGRRQRGFSWTLDRDKAVWFAKRLNQQNTGRVTSGTVLKLNVLALFLGRNEEEIFVMPEHVTMHKTKRV